MDPIKAAEKYAASHKPEDVHPEVAVALHRFATASGDVARAAHGADLLDTVRLLGDRAGEPAAPDPRLAFVESQRVAVKPARKAPAKKSTPAKKTAAKKTPAKRSSSRRKRS